MELTTQQKAAAFDWLCIRCECDPIDPRPYGDEGGNFIGVALYRAADKTVIADAPTAQEALYNAYRKDTGNE